MTTTTTLPADHLARLVCGVGVPSPPASERVELPVWAHKTAPFLSRSEATAPRARS